MVRRGALETGMSIEGQVGRADTMKRFPNGLWALLCALCALSMAAEVASSEPPFLGTTPRRVFTAEEYGASPQAWRGAEDSFGNVYFLDLVSGMVRFDGERWHQVELPIKAYILSIGGDDRFYVGGATEIGMLIWPEDDASSTGVVDRPGFTSLLDQIPEDRRDYGGLQAIFPTEDGVLICTRRYIYRWRDDGPAEVLATDMGSGFGSAFLWQGRLFLYRENRGLWAFGPDGLVPVAGNAALTATRIVGLLEHGPTSALVLTDSHGIFLLEENGIGPSPWAISKILAEQRILSGLRTSDGDYLLTTVRAGAFRLDAQGRLLETFDRSSDPRLNNLMYHAFEDHRGTLWLSTDQGIVQVPRNPIRRIVPPKAIESSFHQTRRFSDRLYVATRTGLYRQGKTDRFASRSELSLERVPGINESTWDLVPFGDVLVVGASQGIYALREAGDKAQIERLCPGIGFTFFAPTRWPDHLIASARGGFQVVERDDGEWRCGQRIDGIDGWISDWAESAAGEIWALVTGSHLYRLTFPDGPTEPPLVQRYELPAETTRLVEIDGQALLLDQRLTAWQPASGAEASSSPFEPRPGHFAGLLGDGDAASYRILAHHPEEHRLWLLADSTLMIAEPDADGNWTRRLAASGQFSPGLDLYDDPDSGKVWITNADGVFLLDPTLERQPAARRARVSRVQEFDSQDVLWQFRPGARELGRSLVLPYARNALRFEFAAAISDQIDGLDYQVRLDGFDDGWSKWSRETIKEYTNLREGAYNFRVRARDSWGAISDEGSFRFEVEPPSYRTFWAYGLYALTFIGLVQLSLHRFRRKLKREQALNRQLREADRIKDEFLANTSHEFRTPLYGMIGLAESMHETQREIPESFRNGLATIIASGHRLQRFLGDILDFSVLEKGRLDLERRPLDLKSLVDRVLTLLRPLADGKDVLLVNGVCDDLLPIEADEHRLEQILLNLAGNAVKFTDAGTVKVAAERQRERVLVTVQDTGIGIAAENQERIFQAFEQADGSTERRLGGTGLGLAISRRLVELHGGRLSVESQAGEGATFSFTLPLAKPGVDVAPTASGHAATTVSEMGRGPVEMAPPKIDRTHIDTGSAIRRILVVDDEPINRLVLSKQLESAGYEVREAADGFQALQHLDDIDLVLLDVMMPRMSGYEVCRRVREHYPATELPIIFVSAKSLPEDVIEGLKSGGNDYLVKPVRMQELLARISVHLDLVDRFQQLTRSG